MFLMFFLRKYIHGNVVGLIIKMRIKSFHTCSSWRTAIKNGKTKPEKYIQKICEQFLVVSPLFCS